MNRCAWAALSVGVALATALSAAPAAAQTSRPFNHRTLRGDLVVTQPPDVLLNGKPARLKPGARIKNQDNMLAMSGSLVGQKIKVHYTLDTAGDIDEAWILTAEEAARKPWPTTPQEAQRWAFDPLTQTWTKQ